MCRWSKRSFGCAYMMSMEEHDAALARHVVAFPPFTFYRLGPLLQRSYEKPVIAEGLPPLQEKETIDLAYHRLARCWEREKASTPNPSLARALYATFKSELWTTLRSGTAWVACAVGQAVALRPLVNSLAESGEASLRAAMISGAGFVLLVIVAGIMLHRMFWYIMKTGWMMKTSCVALLHAKLLKCTSSSVTSSSTGRIYSLVTSDAVRFDNITPIFGPWFALLTMTAAFVALVYDLDAASAAAGIGVCVAAMGLQLRLGFGVQQLRRLTADATDERVRLTKEVVEASSSVKTMGWQKPFANAVFTKRSIETATIWHAQRLRALSQGVYFATVPLSALAAFSVFLWRTPPRSGLTLGKASSAIAVLTVCRTFFYMSARFAMNVPEIFVATRRMRDFLLLPEADGKGNDSGETSSSTNLIDFRNASFAWNHDAVTPASVLTDLTFNLAPGELVIVTGKVGSGKSSVLSAILSELATTSGTAFVRPGKIALCPQPSWNVSGSVKQNVVLGAATIEGRVIDDEAYRATLVATALDVDVEAWPSGDETIVGEKGVTLSGGQAARLALARAVYAASVSGGPKIAVLDDVLSAVDPKVAKHIVDQCLLKTLCRGLNVGCVLATHQRFCLGDADRVLVLGTEGRMLACAPLTDILRDGGEAAELVSTQSGNRMGAAAATSTQENMMQEPRKSDAKPASHTAKMSPVLQVVSKEDRTVGRVTWRTWWSFLGSGGTSPVVVLGTMFIAAQACLMTSDVLLLRLADQKRSRIGSHLYYQYAGLTGAACLLGIVRGLIFFAGTLHSATKLHSRALLRVLHAPLSWITANPIGRILNRFSSDLAQVDDLLSVTLLELSTLFLLMVGSIVISCVALPPVAILVLIMARASYKVKVFVSKTMNELKRLDSITKSPFLSVFSVRRLYFCVFVAKYDAAGDTSRSRCYTVVWVRRDSNICAAAGSRCQLPSVLLVVALQ